MSLHGGLAARWIPTIFLSLCGLSVAGCGGSSGTETTNCATETRADTYSPGMEKLGMQGSLTMRLVQSVPAPPTKGDNDWTLQLRDGKGALLGGAALTVTPYMPDHKHGTSIKAVIKDLGGGTYDIAPLNLFMPGLWTVTIAAQPTGGAADQAVFSFCIDG
jgi:hypothetical protein